VRAVPKVFTIEVKRVMGDKDSPDGLRRTAELEAIHEAIGQAGLFQIQQEINWEQIEDEAGYREKFEQIVRELSTTAGITSIQKTSESTKLVEGVSVWYFTFKIEIDPEKVKIADKSSSSSKVVSEAKKAGEDGTISYNRFGLYLSELTSYKKEALGLSMRATGVFVDNIENGSPAEKCYLLPGDVIISIGEYKVKNIHDFNEICKKLKDRKEIIPFCIVRDGKKFKIGVKQP
jgi:C-terminal processing protease CtpA/Prc